MKTKAVVVGVSSLVMIGIILSILWTQTTHGYEEGIEKINVKLEPNLVCMVNDKYMGKEQIPVIFEGRTYYGCCKGCVSNIQNNRSVRVSIDPYTGQEVDKALAFIVKKSNSTNEVFYFESKENYEKYETKMSI